MPTIDIGRDFSRFPGGRFRTDGPWSGQEFREEVLRPAFLEQGVVTVVLDGVRGLPPSFLEESFGGLVRDGLGESSLEARLRIVAASVRMRRYPSLIWDYIRSAAAMERSRAV